MASANGLAVLTLGIVSQPDPLRMNLRLIKTHYGLIPLLTIFGAAMTGASGCILYSLITKKDVSLWKRPWENIDPPAVPKRVAYKPAEIQGETDFEVK